MSAVAIIQRQGAAIGIRQRTGVRGDLVRSNRRIVRDMLWAVQPAVFLDRDNTLIANDGDLGDPKLVVLVDGVSQGLRALREAGYRLVVVTNQAGVARGRFTETEVDAVHQRIAMLVDQQSGARAVIDRFYYCPYHPEATVTAYRRDHPWRKPHPGMILQAARDMGIDLSRSWMIGDQERDILAGRAAGCRTVLFSRDAELAVRLKPTEVAATFDEAVRAILHHRAASPRPLATQTAGIGPSFQGAGLSRAVTQSAAVSEPPRETAPAFSDTARNSILNPTSPPSAAGATAGASVPSGSQRAAGLTPRFAPVLPSSAVDSAAIRQALSDLSEEIRSDRLRRSEFRFVTMLAGICQLLAITLGLLGLLQLGNFDVFARWLMGAMLLQLLTLTLLALDLRG
jgi:D,D-heptose 1,7-bisphosphate phosphatase